MIITSIHFSIEKGASFVKKARYCQRAFFILYNQFEHEPRLKKII